jgi:methanethiol S-methyltransferase
MKTMSSPVQTKATQWGPRLGTIGFVVFMILYGAELWPWPEALGYWPNQFLGRHIGVWKIALNIAVVIAFLGFLPYSRATRDVWRSRGLYSAFALALMTEMLGWPLIAYLLSPVAHLSGDPYPHGAHWPHAVGTAISLLGLVLVYFGWRRIHGAAGLVTDGLYSWVRHPQYTGIFLFALGWAVHFHTWLTWTLLIPMTLAYVVLARAEEKTALDEFGRKYEEYASRTKRFIPFVV